MDFDYSWVDPEKLHEEAVRQLEKAKQSGDHEAVDRYAHIAAKTLVDSMLEAISFRDLLKHFRNRFLNFGLTPCYVIRETRSWLRRKRWASQRRRRKWIGECE